MTQDPPRIILPPIRHLLALLLLAWSLLAAVTGPDSPAVPDWVSVWWRILLATGAALALVGEWVLRDAWYARWTAAVGYAVLALSTGVYAWILPDRSWSTLSGLGGYAVACAGMAIIYGRRLLQ